MFKNLILFSTSKTFFTSFSHIEPMLQAFAYRECSPSQEVAMGWTAPRGEGALLESINGHWLMQFTIEKKSVPSSAVTKAANERAVSIEAAEGRKPGRKEMNEIREDARQGLIPQAFSKVTKSFVWFDRVNHRLAIDAGSDARADKVLNLLNKSIEGLGITHLLTLLSPSASMASWLTDEVPQGFTVDRETELKAHDDTQAVVRYSKHTLDIDEVRRHIEEGKVPTRLAMTFEDRVSFVLNDKMHIKKIKFLDGVFNKDRSLEDRFDGDATIAPAELVILISCLCSILGGIQSGAEFNLTSLEYENERSAN